MYKYGNKIPKLPISIKILFSIIKIKKNRKHKKEDQP